VNDVEECFAKAEKEPICDFERQQKNKFAIGGGKDFPETENEKRGTNAPLDLGLEKNKT